MDIHGMFLFIVMYKSTENQVKNNKPDHNFKNYWGEKAIASLIIRPFRAAFPQHEFILTAVNTSVYKKYQFPNMKY